MDAEDAGGEWWSTCGQAQGAAAAGRRSRHSGDSAASSDASRGGGARPQTTPRQSIGGVSPRIAPCALLTPRASARAAAGTPPAVGETQRMGGAVLIPRATTRGQSAANGTGGYPALSLPLGSGRRRHDSDSASVASGGHTSTCSSPDRRSRAAVLEEIEAGIRDLLFDIDDPALRDGLEAKLSELSLQLQSARTRVQDLSKENAGLQKHRTEQQGLVAQLDDLELQNKMFEARKFEGIGAMKEREGQAVLEARQAWERTRMCAEDALQERGLIAEIQELQREELNERTSVAADISTAERLLGPLTSRLEELEKVKAEAQYKAKQNPQLLSQISTMRRGKPKFFV